MDVVTLDVEEKLAAFILSIEVLPFYCETQVQGDCLHQLAVRQQQHTVGGHLHNEVVGPQVAREHSRARGVNPEESNSLISCLVCKKLEDLRMRKACSCLPCPLNTIHMSWQPGSSNDLCLLY